MIEESVERTESIVVLRKVTVSVTGAPEHLLPYRYARQFFRPDRLVLEWSRRNGEPWHLHKTISGPRVLTDGLSTKQRLETWSMPYWAQSIIDRERPADD